LSKVKDNAYLALTAMLRAREAKMLDRDRMERMLSAPSSADAAKMLVDCGYEDMSGLDAKMLDAVLNAHKQEIFEEINRMSPEPELVDIFRLRYDYHNAKVVIKSAGAGVNAEYLYSDNGRVEAEALAQAYVEDNYSDIPAALAEAVAEAKAMLAKTGNPQMADFILDRAYFAELSAMAQTQGNKFLVDYVKLMIDSANLRTVVRTVRMEKGADFMLQALIEGGNASPESLVQASGDEGLVNLVPGVLAEAAQLGAEAMKGGSMTKFELACDNAMAAYLATAKYVTFGCPPVVKYLALKETEITAVRMILTGKMAGIDAGVIRERLRDVYA